MRIPIYQVDAFTTELFRGNPAAVCPLEEWPADVLLQSIAAENNLSETAFLVPRDDAFELRWFTPTAEVDLCGHATLASGWVVLERLRPGSERVVFESPRSGRLEVWQDEGRLVMDFPARPARPCDPPPGLVDALGSEPSEVQRGAYLLAVYEQERDIRALRPDMARLAALGEPVSVSAPGDEVDVVSRFFAPSLGIPEDPVTGSAHCTLTPYWAVRLGRSRIVARQLSRRGGEIHCELRGERVLLRGNAVLYLAGTIYVAGVPARVDGAGR